jgi:hypothetical protein
MLSLPPGKDTQPERSREITWTFAGTPPTASVGGVGWRCARYERAIKEIITMNILVAIVAIVAVILLFTGGFVQSLNFLLWVGIVLLIIAAIVWLIRFLTGRRAV